MTRVTIIEAGGVGTVVTHKVAQNAEIFIGIMLASRTKSRCDAIAAQIKNIKIQTAQVDADDVEQPVRLFGSFRPDICINVALPYQDLTVMEACLRAGVNHLDTADYEPLDEAKYQHSWQWAYHDHFKEADLTAVLGCDFDPGVISIFTAYAAKHHSDEMYYLDIMDCNGGDHHKAFATNFNPEINICEITQKGKYYHEGEWIETEPQEIYRPLHYPGINVRESYLLYHEELGSFIKHFPTICRARFWMTFREEYLKYLEMIQNIGMASIEPINYNGQEIVPIQFLKAVLPNPQELGENYTDETSIGCRIRGVRDGKGRTYYIWNNCSHQATYRETGMQGVSYMMGVPAMTGALMLVKGIWGSAGIFNVKRFDPDPFLGEVARQGLPWHESLDIDIELGK